MIFGHAPVIIPAVLGINTPYSPLFYIHLILLHLSLLLRVAGDVTMSVTGSTSLRHWGGLLNEIAIVLFLFLTAVVIWRSKKQQGK
jgi:hypothetical protein